VTETIDSNELNLDLGKGPPEVVTQPPESVPKSSTHQHGCPSCGSARIRRSHAIPAWVTRPFTRKRLYRCSSCGWRGWRHRLEHRRKGSQKEHGHKRGKLSAREVLFFLAFLTAFIWWAVTQSVSCGPGAEPWTPPPLGLHIDRPDGPFMPMA
jgi:predicted RNA-binding Zn-ribbon protein involved in translation (DUF1610 family)